MWFHFSWCFPLSHPWVVSCPHFSTVFKWLSSNFCGHLYDVGLLCARCVQLMGNGVADAGWAAVCRSGCLKRKTGLAHASKLPCKSYNTPNSNIRKCPHPTQNCCFILWERQQQWGEGEWGRTELVFLWNAGGDVSGRLSSLQPARLQSADSAYWPRSSFQPSPRVPGSAGRSHTRRWPRLLCSDLRFLGADAFFRNSRPASFFAVVFFLACLVFRIWSETK